jgi:hypothetical protein
MHQFSRVLFKMNSLDSHSIRTAIIILNFQISILAKGSLILGDLIPFGKIGVEIVLAGESRPPVNRAIHGDAGTDGMLNGPFV